ncbi:uncharacterized protein ACNLHF_027154 [Anomaloglossus baeobatrachus]
MPLVRASIASSTWTAYGKAWQEWCVCAGNLPVASSSSARIEALERYLQQLHAAGSSAALAKNRLSGLAFHFKLRGVSGCSRPSVWVLGHSYVYWAGQRAEVRPGGKSLGFVNAEVNWRGIRGLTWSQVLPEVVNISRTAVRPVVLVLHAGGNDLCSIEMTELLTLMRADIDKFPAFFSQVLIVWSEIVPRVVWRGARDWAGMERTRRTINHRISRFVHFKGGVIVRHRQLEGTNARLMRPDGVHLNDIGLDIFLSGLQDGIEEALFVLGGGS